VTGLTAARAPRMRDRFDAWFRRPADRVARAFPLLRPCGLSPEITSSATSVQAARLGQEDKILKDVAEGNF